MKRYVAVWDADHGLTLLLAFLVVLLFVVAPLANVAGVGELFNDLAFAGLALSGAVTVARRTDAVVAVAIAVIAGLALDWATRQGRGEGLLLADLAMRAAIVGVLGLLVGMRVLGPGGISVHRVQGAIVLYLLAALGWAYAYQILVLFDPRAFRLSDVVAQAPDLELFRFLSFETLTTLGYGDVLPSSAAARALTSSEALFGQLYPAVMIARLVSREIGDRRGGRDGTPRP